MKREITIPIRQQLSLLGSALALSMVSFLLPINELGAVPVGDKCPCSLEQMNYWPGMYQNATKIDGTYYSHICCNKDSLEDPNFDDPHTGGGGSGGGGGDLYGGGGSGDDKSCVPKSIYVHGFHAMPNVELNTVNCHGDTSGTCNNKWASKTGVFFVGYDGRVSPFTLSNGPVATGFSNGTPSGPARLLDALERNCRRDEGKCCRIVNHSMGGLLTSYVNRTLNTYTGWWTNSSEHHGITSGPYDVLSVTSLASAEGGSPLAEIAVAKIGGLLSFTNNLAALLTFLGIDTNALYNTAVFDLRRDVARTAFDHDIANSVVVYHVAGTNKWNGTLLNGTSASCGWSWNSGSFFSSVGTNNSSVLQPAGKCFSGKHDTVVSFASQCGYSSYFKIGSSGNAEPIPYARCANWYDKSFAQGYAPWDGHAVWYSSNGATYPNGVSAPHRASETGTLTKQAQFHP